MPGDMVFTLGAGDVWKVSEELIPLLKKGEAVKGKSRIQRLKGKSRKGKQRE
jgi:hypothetical protein